MLPSTIVAN